MTAIQTAVQTLANAARVAVELGSLTKTQAAKLVCENAVEESRAAMQRTGVWRAESTTEQIEAILCLGSVAADAIADRERPSVGNVRQALINAI